MEEIRCPKCGSLMVLRTAKKGKEAGNKFYGCSRYPKCRATLPIESMNNKTVPEEEKLPLIENFFPQTLIAQSRFQDYQVRFFENVAVPENLLEKIILEDVEQEILKAFSQWRIDYPVRESKSVFTERHQQIISVLEKILTRGRITLLSPQLERKFTEVFRLSTSEFSLSIIEPLVLRGYKKFPKKLWLDSKEENIFYEEILPKLLGENYQQFTLPQVEISSLLPANKGTDTTGYRRVDFAIFHPKLKERLIVEIDGEQHKKDENSDRERDRILQENGYTVIRIPVDEIRRGMGKQLSILDSKLSLIRGEQSFNLDRDNIKFIHAIKIAYQIQVALLQAIQSGFLYLENGHLWHIVADIDELEIFNRNEALEVLKESVLDFTELLRRICKIYSINLDIKPICELISEYVVAKSNSTVFLSFSDKVTTDLPTFYIQNIYFPFHISHSSLSAPPVIGGLEKPDEEDLVFLLQYIFRKPHFWEGQYEAIVRVLQGKDTLLLLPTGAGKSMVYQLSSFLLPGRTVIIQPIISLMEDQIGNLAMMGIDRCIAITSQIADSRIRSHAIELFGQGEYIFAYVAPERFQTTEFRESLRTLTIHTPVALIVVDEAHCVSEWGHDFRTAYLNIGRTTREYCKSNNYIPPLLALTGTASKAVLKDIKRELKIKDFDAVITPKSFDRKELRFDIIYSNSEEKIARLKGYLGNKLPSLFKTTVHNFYQTRGKDTYCGLVFCPHVGGEFGVERVADKIRKDLGIYCDIYSGKEPKNWDSNLYRTHKQNVTKRFKHNKIPLLVCTKSFGMGIDKPNIRYTIHLGVPPSIESFYQEAGRAGRDRNTAYCCIIVSIDDHKRAEKLLDPNTTVEEINKVIENIPWEENDDITRVLYFHVRAFLGIDKEKKYIWEVLHYIGDVSKKGKKTISIPERIKQNTGDSRQAREITEKALHRLLLIGVISDYTVDYSREEFNIELSGASKEEIIETYGKYVEGYHEGRKQVEIERASKLLSLPYPDFITGIIELLLEFIYDVIERGRRRAFYEMLLACSGSPNDDAFRKRILRYLETTEYSGELEQIIGDKQAGIMRCKDIFKLDSPTEAAELRGQVSRYLESYPDHPALLMLRSLSEVFSKDKENEVAKQNFLAAIYSALTKYGLSRESVFEFAVWAILKILEQDKKLVKELVYELTRFRDRFLARLLIKKLPIEFAEIPAWFLLENLEKEVKSLIFRKGGD